MTHAPERPKFIGAAVKRLEDPRLVTGAGRYLDDLEEDLACSVSLGRVSQLS